jgi:hypothetical protein
MGEAGGGVTTSFEGTTGPPATTFIRGEKIAITAKANAVFMTVLLIDTKITTRSLFGWLLVASSKCLAYC